MNTRIEKDFYFQTGIHFENKYHINSYEIVLSILVETESAREKNIAMDRITYFLSDVIQNAVIVNCKDTTAIQLYKNANLKVCELPDDPHDQIFAMVLLLKLNAITEGRIKITDMVLGSSLSDGVKYNIVSEVAECAFSKKAWWNQADGSVGENEDANDKIVNLFAKKVWVELGLIWKERVKK